MKRAGISTALLAILLPAESVGADPLLIERQITRRGPFDLCGYEATTKAPKIAERFENCGRFSAGIAPVRFEGRVGFIDNKGDFVIPPRFDQAGYFHLGHAEFIIDGKAGIIDRHGTIIIPAQFGRILPFTHDTFFASASGYYPTSARPQSILFGFAQPIRGFSSFSGGLYKVGKGWLTPRNLEFEFFDAPERGLVWASSLEGSRKWGLMRADGTWQVPPSFTYVGSLSERLAVIRTGTSDNSPSGAVDANGRLVIPAKFEWLAGWRGGYALTRSGKREGLLKPDGTLLAGRYFTRIDKREDGFWPRALTGGRWYSLSPDGRMMPDQTDGMILNCPSGFRFRQVGERVEISHAKRQAPIGIYENTYFLQRDCGTILSVKRGEKWGYILPDGTPVPRDPIFDDISRFGKTYAQVKQGGLWGIIDRTGNFVVPPTYSTFLPQADGIKVGNGLRTFWIDESGSEIAEPKGRNSPARNLQCNGSLELFKEAEFWGMRSFDGRTIIPAKYLALSCFTDGVSYAARLGRRGWCPVGPDAEEREKPACLETYYPSRTNDGDAERFTADNYENSVAWNRAWLDYANGTRSQPPKWSSSAHYRSAMFPPGTKWGVLAIVAFAGLTLVMAMVGWARFVSRSAKPEPG